MSTVPYKNHINEQFDVEITFDDPKRRSGFNDYRIAASVKVFRDKTLLLFSSTFFGFVEENNGSATDEMVQITLKKVCGLVDDTDFTAQAQPIVSLYDVYMYDRRQEALL